MANEKLIPLSEVKKKLTAVRQYFFGYPSTDQDKLARSVVKLCMEEVGKIKPVDAVEVIRCKDCKHRGTDLCPMETVELYPWFGTRNDAFCSYGERRTDNA